MMDYFRMLAGFNAWANERLYAACESLPEAEYKKDRKAFFGSIHGTLNHLLVCDIVWFDRIEGGRNDIRALDQILHDNLASLKTERREMDARIVAFAHELDGLRLSQIVQYNTMDGQPHRTPMPELLGTVFNHQTHHRGQVHNMLSQADVAPPPLDILVYLDGRR